MANTKSKKTKKSSSKSKATVAKTQEAKQAKKVKAVKAEDDKELTNTVAETTEVEEVEVEEPDEVEEIEIEEVETIEVEETEDDDDSEEITPVKVTGNPFKGFFAKKCDKSENILTIFKSPRIWGAILGEVVGTMLMTIILLTLGIYQPLYIMFGLLAVTMAVYAFSGAHLNPIATAGMMATRRVSAIRGILYIVAQVLGAWFGLLIANAFRMGGEAPAELPTMAGLENETIWSCILIELVGAIIIGYFFTRAQAYRSRRGAFTYAAMIAGGTMVAILFGIVISGNFLGLQNNFAMNPAVAIMYQIFPTTAENFGALMGQIALAGATYIIVPMIGGILGSFLSDISSKLVGEGTCQSRQHDHSCPCPCCNEYSH